MKRSEIRASRPGPKEEELELEEEEEEEEEKEKEISISSSSSASSTSFEKNTTRTTNTQHTSPHMGGGEDEEDAAVMVDRCRAPGWFWAQTPHQRSLSGSAWPPSAHAKHTTRAVPAQSSHSSAGSGCCWTAVALSNAMAAAASSSAATVAPSSSELLLSSSASAASCCGQEVANAVPIALRKLIVLTVTVVTALILAGD